MKELSVIEMESISGAYSWGNPPIFNRADK